jgi:hypothetical protein
MLITVRRTRYIGPNPARPATARECRTAQHSAAGCLTGADLSCRPGAEARAMTTAFTVPRTDPIVPTRVEPRINCNQSALHPTHLPWTGGSNAPSLMLQNRLTGACLVVSDLATEIVTSNSSSTRGRSRYFATCASIQHGLGHWCLRRIRSISVLSCGSNRARILMRPAGAGALSAPETRDLIPAPAPALVAFGRARHLAGRRRAKSMQRRAEV